ncbi:MAG: hydroxyacid dehydrogenase [Myxococcales bacterium]|nr:hydroxyacid dehydrogenase [Myxococcales bacterium]
MKILIADKVPDDCLEALQALGLDISFQPTLGADDLPSAVGEAQVLVVRSTRVTAETIDAAEHLQMIIRGGAGTNTIDCDHAAKNAIHVANCPGKNAVAVAELTLGLILSLDRFIPDNVISLRNGSWEKSRFGKGRGLLGQTLGIIGLGRIGQEVLQRGKAFGMNCIGWSRSLTPERARELGIEYCESVHDLCRQADVITVHVAYSDQTHHLIGTKEIAAMKPGSTIIHMARGGVVDDKALREAVSSGHIRAASDVYEEEPKGGKAEYNGPFQDVDGFYGTHHVGASTIQAQQAIGEEIVRIVEHWMSTGDVFNCVNRTNRQPGCGQLLVRHLDKVGVLASVLDVVKRADLSVKEMHNTVFDNTGAATAAITLNRPPGQEVLVSIRASCGDVLGVEWIQFDSES